MDGKIATDTGESQWITGEQARKYVHLIRSRSDAILVGRGTVVADNPSLNVRYGYSKSLPLSRIVMDENLSIPMESRILYPLEGYPTIIAAGQHAVKIKPHKIPAGNELLPCRLDEDGVDPEDLLSKLGKKQITSLLVEGGPRILSSFVKKKLADRILIFLAPRIIGDNGAPSAVASIHCHKLEDTPNFRIRKTKKLGNDVLIELYPVE
jgi:diaminohydroxyphosphoribosylaminopyrimidine deaminase/5-amino-6-(5-phosphoribosylamino)uracil reductase